LFLVFGVFYIIFVDFIKQNSNPYLMTGNWLLERLVCWDARKRGSMKVCNLMGSKAFELSCLIACQPASKTLTFEP
jgi:hypothetical protein